MLFVRIWWNRVVIRDSIASKQKLESVFHFNVHILSFFSSSLSAPISFPLSCPFLSPFTQSLSHKIYCRCCNLCVCMCLRGHVQQFYLYVEYCIASASMPKATLIPASWPLRHDTAGSLSLNREYTFLMLVFFSPATSHSLSPPTYQLWSFESCKRCSGVWVVEK